MDKKGNFRQKRKFWSKKEIFDKKGNFGQLNLWANFKMLIKKGKFYFKKISIIQLNGVRYSTTVIEVISHTKVDILKMSN